MEWRKISRYPLYEISDKGDVRRVIGGRGARIGPVRWRYRGAGYATVALYDGAAGRADESVHRLVAETFLGPPPPGKPNALHRDGNSANNDRANVYWGDQADNAEDRARHGRTRTPPNKGENNPASKLTDAQVNVIRTLYIHRHESAKALAARFGVRRDTIYAIASGKIRAQRVQNNPGRNVSHETVKA